MDIDFKLIEVLKPNEVHVFCSNERGFHGAGQAAWVMIHQQGNAWRTAIVPHPDPNVRRTLVQLKPGEKGYWAQKGIAKGLQEGWYGKSYGVVTALKIGKYPQKASLDYIRIQFTDLCLFAHDNPLLTFHIPPIGTGYVGYQPQQIIKQIHSVFDAVGEPENFHFLWDMSLY